MIIEIGHFAVVLALVICILQTIIPMIGAIQGRENWMAVARPAAQVQFVMISLGFITLMHAFLVNDFSVAYVAHNSNSALLWYYRLAAVWGAHEGSLLLWCLILSGWTICVSCFSKSLTLDFTARVLSVMGFISTGFLCLLLFTSNPFERLIPAAMDGRDLNPLLQDIGLIMHPPILYMGYVGFSVAFSFAVAALSANKLDSSWARWSRPWTLIAWGFLTLGIALGSWWAYYELGWGGWWFWDPVENASFMPWLAGTALIHSLIVTDKRGAFKSWTVLLAIAAFSLSLLGTFLVRSGVLTSVHSFAADPVRGVAILIFISLVAGISLLLYGMRAGQVRSYLQASFLSRDYALLANNIIILVAASVVFLGTLYPLFLDALNLGKVSVGPPYFNTMLVPLFLLLGVLTAIGPLLRWRHDHLQELVTRLRLPYQLITCGVILSVIIMLDISLWLVFGLSVAGWIVCSSICLLMDRVKHSSTLLAGLFTQPLSFYAMLLAHTGFALSITGVTLVTALELENDLGMTPNVSKQIGDYEYIFRGVEEIQAQNYRALRGTFDVMHNGRHITRLHPEKRHYPVQNSVMTEAAIDAGLSRDIYISLGDPLEGDTWSVRIYYKPFIRFVWLGGVLMFLAGIIAACDRRYKLRQDNRARLKQLHVQEA